MSKSLVLNGNHAAAEALRQINPDVFGFYPITPTSYIGEKFSKYVADNKVDTEYVSAESEHAAMSICVGAAAAGGRAVTATASQGLLLMTEVLWNASGMRLPIVLINGNRALGAPLSIHGDHNDIMSVRDCGWIQLFAKDAQEVYDFLICSFLISEHKQVRTPIMVCMDCFQTTHTMMNINIETDEKIKKFVGETICENPLLDIKNPIAYGNYTNPEFYMEFRRQQLEGIINSEPQIKTIFSNFSKNFGRGNDNLIETYQCKNAEIIVVVLGSTYETLKRSIDFLRKKEKKVGLVRLKIFRPFPDKELKKILGESKKTLVLDRMSPAGAQFGALGLEISNIFINEKKSPEIKNAIYGLGGRETHFKDFVNLIENFDKLKITPQWVNLK